MYKLTRSTSVVRMSDGMTIPAEPTLIEWQEYQAWIASGNIPDPYVAPMPTEAETLITLTAVIQEYLDAKPKERLYDGILSLCTYATSLNPTRAAEGQAGVVWRDACWDKGYEIMDAVKSGARLIPSREELIAMLPTFVWPDDAN